MKGILNLYKPKGITSSDAVVKCRRILGTKAIGHMGTLDPAGEGVLLLGVGKATRLFDYYLSKDKIYEAQFRFGYTTDTIDGDGVIVGRTEKIPSRLDIEKALSNFVGELNQIPPIYSAKSVNGVRAYKLARCGKDVELSPCKVRVYSFELVNKTCENTYLFRIHCSSGTYIRSLCRDLGQFLNTMSVMISIKRIRCSNFDVKDSVTMEELGKRGAAALVPVEEAVSDLPKCLLPDEYFVPLSNGIKIPAPQCDGEYALYCKDLLFGIAHNVDGIIKIKTYLRD